MTEDYNWGSTGQYESVQNKFNYDYTEDPRYKAARRNKAHLWIFITTYVVDNPANMEMGVLDHENLLMIQGPGCFICEQVYKPETAYKKCRGDVGA